MEVEIKIDNIVTLGRVRPSDYPNCTIGSVLSLGTGATLTDAKETLTRLYTEVNIQLDRAIKLEAENAKNEKKQ